MSCWWPCCDVSYNLLALDMTGAEVWRLGVPIGAKSVIGQIHLDWPYLYITPRDLLHADRSSGSFVGAAAALPSQVILAKYDLSGDDPTEVWTVKMSDLPASYSSATTLYVNSYVTRFGESVKYYSRPRSCYDGTNIWVGWAHNGGSVLKFDTDGNLVTRFGIPENSSPTRMKQILGMAVSGSDLYISSTYGAPPSSSSTNLFKVNASTGVVSWQVRTGNTSNLMMPARLLTSGGDLYWGGAIDFGSDHETGILTWPPNKAWQVIGRKNTSTGAELWTPSASTKLTLEYVNANVNDLTISPSTGYLFAASEWNGTAITGEDAIASDIIHAWNTSATYQYSTNPNSPAASNRYGRAVTCTPTGITTAGIHLAHMLKADRWLETAVPFSTGFDWSATYGGVSVTSTIGMGALSAQSHNPAPGPGAVARLILGGGWVNA